MPKDTIVFTYSNAFLIELLSALQLASEERELYDAKFLSIVILKNSHGNFDAFVSYIPDQHEEEK